MSIKLPLRLGTLQAACRMIGGDEPIHKQTYYRGVRKGYYPPPIPVSENLVRVDLDELAQALQARRVLPTTPHQEK